MRIVREMEDFLNKGWTISFSVIVLVGLFDGERAELGGGKAELFFEKPAEIIGIGVAYHFGDFLNGSAGGRQQAVGLLHPVRDQIVDGADAGIFFEHFREVLGAHPIPAGQITKRMLPHMMKFNVASRFLYHALHLIVFGAFHDAEQLRKHGIHQCFGLKFGKAVRVFGHIRQHFEGSK
ncbi:hypothetical protein D3C75_948790 [compost metagenome]